MKKVIDSNNKAHHLGDYASSLLFIIGSLDEKRADIISKNILDLLFSDIKDDPLFKNSKNNKDKE